MTTPREEWHRQVDDIADDYLDIALRRSRPMTLVLHLDAKGHVPPASVKQEVEAAQKLERVKA